MKPLRGLLFAESVCVVPEAQQLVPLVQVTDRRIPWVSGVVTADQLEPSQCSASVTGPGSEPASWAPTAQQLAVLVQVTPQSSDTWLPEGVPLGTMDHVDPSQCSIMATGWPLFRSAMVPPTAQQFHELVHVVPSRRLVSCWLELALVTMVQPEAGADWAVAMTTEEARRTTSAATIAIVVMRRAPLGDTAGMAVQRNDDGPA